jgi:hypothetical protein
MNTQHKQRGNSADDFFNLLFIILILAGIFAVIYQVHANKERSKDQGEQIKTLQAEIDQLKKQQPSVKKEPP